MPLVRRKITEELEHLYAKQTNVHTLYVTQREKLPGDEVVPVAEIDDAMLRDLAITHPREYGVAAKAREIDTTVEEFDDEEFEAEPEIEFTEDQEAFLALGDEEAIEQVKATDDAELLAAFLDAEQKSAAPRRKVIEAIGRRA